MKNKKRQFGHADAQSVKSFLNRIDYIPTIEQIISCCGLGNVKLKGPMSLIEWLDICSIEYKNN